MRHRGEETWKTHLESYSQHDIVDPCPSGMSRTSCRWKKLSRWRSINTHTHVRTKWMAQTNVVEYFLCIGSAKYTKASPPARKISLFSSNLISQNSVVMYTFSNFFRPPFLGKFGQKNQNCQFILKFGTWTNSNMQNSMKMFNFPDFDWNDSFWANLV